MPKESNGIENRESKEITQVVPAGLRNAQEKKQARGNILLGNEIYKFSLKGKRHTSNSKICYVTIPSSLKIPKYIFLLYINY